MRSCKGDTGRRTVDGASSIRKVIDDRLVPGLELERDLNQDPLLGVNSEHTIVPALPFYPRAPR